MGISKKCIVCDKEFTAKNDKGIYCSPSCRVKAHRKREKEGKTELEKNISENYAAELLHFRTNLNIIFKDVEQLKQDMLSVVKYMNVFTEKVMNISQISDISKIENSISELSDKFEERIDIIQARNERKIESNYDNIRLIGLKINDIVHEINLEKPQSNVESTFDKLLANDKIIDFAQNLFSKKTEKDEPKSEAEPEN